MLAHGHVPDVLVGAGYGAVNAVLAASANADRFVRGWERLRARRFIMAAALDDAGGLAARLAPGEGLDATVRRAAASADLKTITLLAVGERFIALDSKEGARAADLLPGALRRTDVEPDTISAGIHAAVEAMPACPDDRATTVTVWGADQWAASSPLVLKAISDAAKAGAAVRFIHADTLPAPSMLELILPGAGTVDRAIKRGSEAALAALDAERQATARDR